MASDFEALLQSTSVPVKPLLRGARALVYEVMPDAIEVVWPRQGTAGYGIGPRKMTEQFVWLAPATAHLSFGFYYGAQLPDPDTLLEGEGKLMRHVKVRSAEDLERPELRRLVEDALADITVRRSPPTHVPLTAPDVTPD